MTIAPPENRPSQQAITEFAREARQRRSEVLGMVTTSELSIRAVAAIASVEPAVARLTVFDVLRALPKWGPAAASSALDAAGVARGRTMGWLASRHDKLDRIAGRVDGGGVPRPSAPGRFPWFHRVPAMERA